MQFKEWLLKRHRAQRQRALLDGEPRVRGRPAFAKDFAEEHGINLCVLSTAMSGKRLPTWELVMLADIESDGAVTFWDWVETCSDLLKKRGIFFEREAPAE